MSEGHRARKRFGQNFLVDRRIIARIIDAIAAREDDTVVEIGPGQGALTEHLLRTGTHLHVVEVDRDLGALWTARATPRFTVHIADALRFDFTPLAPPGGLRVVGNLPYNISTPLLFHLLENAATIRDMHFMLQQEVVERMAAAPGTEAYGRLSVMVQYHCTVQPLFPVPPQSFDPVPRVMSAVVRLVPRAQPELAATDLRVFAATVRDAFSQRRKTLYNALGRALDPATLDALGFDAQRRPETLAVAEFVRLANAIAARAG